VLIKDGRVGVGFGRANDDDDDEEEADDDDDDEDKGGEFIG